MPQGDPLTYFVEAERQLEAGITEIARLGADTSTTDRLRSLADELRAVVQALGKGQYATADNAGPAPRSLEEGTAALQAAMQASEAREAGGAP